MTEAERQGAREAAKEAIAREALTPEMLVHEQIKEMLFASAHVHESGARIIHPAAFIDLIRKQDGN